MEMSKKEQILALRKQGLKHKEIAERLGISEQYSSQVCGAVYPMYATPVGSECVYPNLREWMNENRVSRKEFLQRMGLTVHQNNYDRLNSYMTGKYYPRKPYIDKMLEVTGMTYETLFYVEQMEVSADG